MVATIIYLKIASSETLWKKNIQIYACFGNIHLWRKLSKILSH